jgi:GxxExxY protein
MALELEPLTECIIGCGIEVHRVLGPGLPELACEAAMAIEMKERGLTFLRQPIVPIHYKGHVIGECRPDFIVEHKVVVELKCAVDFDPVFANQILTYLKATQIKVGLLINFHMPTLKAGLRRYVL